MKKFWVILGILLGLVFVVIGYLYATHTAANLPHYFPGFQADYNNIHVKHTIAAFIAAAACFVFAWFKSGPKTTT